MPMLLHVAATCEHTDSSFMCGRSCDGVVCGGGEQEEEEQKQEQEEQEEQEEQGQVEEVEGGEGEVSVNTEEDTYEGAKYRPTPVHAHGQFSTRSRSLEPSSLAVMLSLRLKETY